MKKRNIVFVVLLTIFVTISVLSIRHQVKLTKEAAEMKTYLENRHNLEFVLVEPLYNWKFGSYGGSYYPKGHPDKRFYAEKMKNGYVASSFVEEWWVKQAETELTPLVKEKLGEDVVISISPVHGVDEELNITHPIPSYKEVKSSLSVFITFKETWKNDQKRKQQMIDIVQMNQQRNIEETTFSFENKDKSQYNISIYTDKPIKTMKEFDEQAQVFYFDKEGFLSEAKIDGTIIGTVKEG
ncbi:hypothetical protein [Bacillus sp. CGMCC 1.16541]|uniref:hypothetical protein n=1 Tax=Bacillus sp. CGMCC 1.16541 TaxID=2185143 RepID=UPI000D734277|nr:hypothetical protein [Bacillus sp. CGMCC 1.16541]